VEKNCSFVNKLLNMQHFLSYIDNRLGSRYSRNELKSITHLLLKELAGMSSVQIYCDKDTKFTDDITFQLNTSVERLFNGEPIQYILGQTIFFDLPFVVRPGVLIPRPETEELVELILKDFRNKTRQMQLLDIGTGSGCIAVSLAKNLLKANVSAWDISKDALEIAVENAEINKVCVNFCLMDVRDPELLLDNSEKWDVIVSNPPYVCESEKATMESHVLEHEPHLALFINDDDPLIFYRIISEYAANHLHPGGGLYFEINSHLGKETLLLVKQHGFGKAELLQDLSGRDRMIRAFL